MTDRYSDVFSDKQTVMFVFAHPDDAEIYAGGTISRLSADGKRVIVVKMTSGNKGSRQEQVTEKELADIRRSEDSKAMEIMGVAESDNVYLDLGDGSIEDSIENIGKVAKLIRTYKPEILITHNPEHVIIRHSKNTNWVNHRDHMNTGKITTYAAYPYSRDLLFFPEHFEEEGIDSHSVTEFLYVDYYGHEDEISIEITEQYDSKVSAIAAHSSQYSLEDAKGSADFLPRINSREKTMKSSDT